MERRSAGVDARSPGKVPWGTRNVAGRGVGSEPWRFGLRGRSGPIGMVLASWRDIVAMNRPIIFGALVVTGALLLSSRSRGHVRPGSGCRPVPTGLLSCLRP